MRAPRQAPRSVLVSARQAPARALVVAVPHDRTRSARGRRSVRAQARGARRMVCGEDHVAFGGNGRKRVRGDRRPVSRVLSVHSRANAFLYRTVIPLGVQSPERSSSLPAARWLAPPLSRRAVSRRLFGLAPAGVCRAADVAADAVGSYPTISPLPQFALRRFVFCCAVRHMKLTPHVPRNYLATCPVEPGLSSANPACTGYVATVRPTTVPCRNIHRSPDGSERL